MRITLARLCSITAVLVLLPSTALSQEVPPGIEEANAAWEAAWNAGDIDALAALYAGDAVALPPGGEPVEGREAILSYWRAQKEESPGATSQLETVEVHALDDVVLERGGFVVEDADGGHLDHGKYMVVWKRTEDGWKIARDIWNSSMTP